MALVAELADFEQRRGQNCGELRKPLDPAVFVHDLRSEMTAALGELDTAVPILEWLDITDRAAGAITLSKYEAAPEPRNLRRIKAEVHRRWGTVALIDILKETVLRTGCLADVSAVAGSGTLPVAVLAERLMLAIYAYGTNTGSARTPARAHQPRTPCREDHQLMTADSYPDLLERLFAEFQDRQPLAVIEHIVRQCRDQLDSQTSPDTELELLERLARQRLTDLNP